MIKAFFARMSGKKSAGAEPIEVVLSLRLKERANQVIVAASFNRWSCFSHPLRLLPSGVWHTTVRLVPGTYQYRFLVDNSTWMPDPLARTVLNEFGGTDSVLVVVRPAAVRAQENKFEGQYA